MSMKPTYESPLCSRYASKKMQHIFSPDFKFSTWRRLWIALAESEKELGLNITQAQIDQMRAHIDDIDYERVAEYEKNLRHDVMAHLHAFGDLCPLAMPIIHLGATSCYVGDNTDVIQMREGLLQIRRLLLTAIDTLADFAARHRDTATLAYTHFQAAQPTTLGKRATLWLQDFLMDLERLDFELNHLRLLGCKGTTGTGASFLELFGGDQEKVRALEGKIAGKMGFEKCMPVSGQTYSRKIDSYVMNVLSGIAQSASKLATDTRLLSHLKEFDEPFESGQVGSSAMAYKRNPMRSERVCSLARYILCDAQNPAFTAATQWLERTLDDSANRRLSLPEAFLALDAVLELYANVTAGIVVYPKMIQKHVMENLPFMATENILMEGVKGGGDRQKLHEIIRVKSHEATLRMRGEGLDNDLLDRLAQEPGFPLDKARLDSLLDPKLYTGRSAQQVEQFIRQEVDPCLTGERLAQMGEISV